jgi:glycosyltransferase involved in cell wall biosynthesis
LEYFFYSQGNEWYGQGIHGVRGGDFRHTYLPGFQLTQRTRIAPSLLAHLWRNDYNVFVKCINGRFALPATYLIAQFVGYVTPEDAQFYYSIADLLVLPSVTLPAQKETWGLVVNEVWFNPE